MSLLRGLPIDLLADRSVETVSAWLKKHPSIDTISRDGSSEYASAIKKGAPQARQVSDRWHLVKNLAACVSVQLAQSLAELRRAEQVQAQSEKQERGQVSEERHPAQTRAIQHAQLVRQAERMARYEHIVALQKQGVKIAEIALQLGVTQRTIQRWIATETIPYSRPRRQRPRLIDPYKTYLLSRWHQGCHKGAQLERELRAKGYKGSGRAMYRYLQTLEPTGFSAGKRGSVSATSLPNPLLALSALHMARERRGEQLDAWLEAAQASHLEAFQPFMTGVQQDKDAVFAGLSLPWSNGPLEGNVNRLKLIKRSMYGRAEIDLLKLRVLHRSKANQDRKDKQKKKQGQQVVHLKKPKSMKNAATSQHITTGISKVA